LTRFFGLPLPSEANNGGRMNATTSAKLEEWLMNLKAKFPLRPKGGLPKII